MNMISSSENDKLTNAAPEDGNTPEQAALLVQEKKIYTCPELVSYGKLTLGNVLKIVSL